MRFVVEPELPAAPEDDQPEGARKEVVQTTSSATGTSPTSSEPSLLTPEEANPTTEAAAETTPAAPEEPTVEAPSPPTRPSTTI